MMKDEFEQLCGCPVTYEEYVEIEMCYMAFDNLFPCKQDIADFYSRNGMEVLHRLYNEAVSISADSDLLKKSSGRIKELETFINDIISVSSSVAKYFSGMVGQLFNNQESEEP